MKVKFTLVIGQHRKDLHFTHPLFFQIFLTEQMEFPSGYISTKDLEETLDINFKKYFHLDFSWLSNQLAGIRKIGPQELEIVYIAYTPEVLGSMKSGGFYSSKELKELQVEIEPFYDQLLSGRTQSF